MPSLIYDLSVTHASLLDRNLNECVHHAVAAASYPGMAKPIPLQPFVNNKKMGSYAPPPPAIASRLGSQSLLQLLMLVFLLSQVTIAFILGPISHDLLGIQLFSAFEPNVLRQTMAKWSMEDKIRFEKHFLVDFWFHPTVYSFMFLVWLTLETKLANKSPLPYFLFALIPIAGGLCDIIENSIHLSLLKSFPEGSDNYIRLGGFFATIKWVLVIPVGIWCLRSYLLRRKQKTQ